MKKLMIAAAAAAMVGGAYATPCTPEDTPAGDCASVYSFKLNVKTTKGVTLKGGTVGSGSQCTPGTPSSCTVIREKDSTVIQGYIYDCSCGCGVISTGSVVAWDSKRKAKVEDPAFTTAFINVMGKKASLAEWAWTFAGTAQYDETRSQAYALTGAGYGSFSKGMYRSFSGNFAGKVEASYDLKTKKGSDDSATSCACDPSQVWACDALNDLTAADTVAFGTWTAKYDASASKKYLANGFLNVPAYAR